MADSFTWMPIERQPASLASSWKLHLTDYGDGSFGYAVATIPGLPLHIAGAATTVVKSGAGRLLGIVVNKAIALSVITLYDNTAASGTIIGIITNPLVLLSSQFNMQYDAAFTMGLTIVTSAADDLTVIYL